ncbi:Fic family protein [Marinobacter sp. ELB17]|uniref:Fic family protein n=1 Tax=Marinobacter sp. ELB17 TaxID=270374 RepID=UPI0000F388C9|nr:Fic family protein [Marinobacter sp. ELB17]EAZ97295.1 putative filamentation induced by cAMP protein Fic [Marinobacter sp. ELB17]EAZ97331.1 putative filamentation induced by cAMP protein Fic [Marinobacter sp. ELB17]
MSSWAGYAWLQKHFDIPVTQKMPIRSQIGRDRKTSFQNGVYHETYRPNSKPDDTPSAHLAFALKHEGIHLELLSHVFERYQKQALTDWVASEPTGQYTRKAGFLYEWLTGDILTVPEMSGNYHNLLNPHEVVAAETPIKNSRWRINDNLPGTPHFCPIIRRTELLDIASNYDSNARLKNMEDDFGAELMSRSAVWLTIRESRASFAIEHEGDQKSKIHRFALAMGRYCGQIDAPLSSESLTELQNSILGTSTIRPGLRQSPVFVGSGTQEMGSYVHYVAPDANEVKPMLEGLQAFMAKTQHESPIVRAAVASFGFVFIHPMADGNGRISRFLINDSLRRDSAVPEPLLLPISSTINKSTGSRNNYDKILEAYSRPMMAKTTNDIRFGDRTTYPDGVVSDFKFSGNDTLRPAWRYPDLTEQSEYLFHVIHETIEYEMRHQIESHQSYINARDKVKDTLEGPNEHIDRIMRSVERNDGQISNKLEKEFPMLKDPETSESIKNVINAYVAGRPLRRNYDPDMEVETLRESIDDGPGLR